MAETPVFLASPMAEKATLIYGNYPKIFNAHIQGDLASGSPFEFPGLIIIATRDDNDALHKQTGPKVIIAGSGMMTGGRILELAAHFLPIASTRLFIVGYQGEETLGHQILVGSKQVTIDGVTIPILASVNSTQSMSSHADQKQLTNWLQQIKNVQKVILTHGEDGPRKALAQKISQELGYTDVVMPVLHQEISL